MASVSAASVAFGSSLKLLKSSQISENASSLKMANIGWATSGFPSLRISRFRVSCSAKPKTIEKVCEIVRTQLALSAETELTPESKFTTLGADSLDTVEIVMNLEEEFGISIEEENSQNISTVQEAADLIEKLVEEKTKA